MTNRKGLLTRLSIAVTVMLLAPAVSLAGDESFSSVVKHIKSNYRAKQQGFFGMMMLARFAVKVVKPAGVKNFKVTMLTDLDYSGAARPETAEFHAAIRNRIHPTWQPLIQYSAPREKQWSYIYVTEDKKDVKILAVTVQERQAFVFQLKFSPEKLSQFISDPKLMGISLKGDERHRDASAKPAEGADDDDDDEHPSEKQKPVLVKPPQ